RPQGCVDVRIDRLADEVHRTVTSGDVDSPGMRGNKSFVVPVWPVVRREGGTRVESHRPAAGTRPPTGPLSGVSVIYQDAGRVLGTAPAGKMRHGTAGEVRPGRRLTHGNRGAEPVIHFVDGDVITVDGKERAIAVG